MTQDNDEQMMHLQEQLASSEARSTQLQELLATSEARALSAARTEADTKNTMEEYLQFEGVMQFLENSLRFTAITTAPTERDQLKSGISHGGAPGEQPQQALEATLTRVMQSSETKITKLQSELDACRAQLAEKEALLGGTTEHLEQRVAKLAEENAAAEAYLAEAKTRADDLSKALARSDKGKSSIQSARDLLKKLSDKQALTLKDKEDYIMTLKEDRNYWKEEYGKAKSRMSRDLAEIDQLSKLLSKAEKANWEKDDSLRAFRTKLQALEKEKNDGLKDLGRLQEELAAKDLELSNARSTCAGFESAAKMAEQEREALMQRLLIETDIGKQRQTVATNLVNERVNERDFLKTSIEASEEKAGELTARIQQLSDQLREKDTLIVSLRSNIAQFQEELEGSQESQKPYQRLLEEQQQQQQQSQQRQYQQHPQHQHQHQQQQQQQQQVSDVGQDDDEEMVLDLNKALARILSFEELVISLEEEVAQAKQVQEEMLTVHEDLRRTVRELGWKEEKAARVDRDLQRRGEDLQEKMTELVECKVQLQQQTMRAEVLETERQSLRHQIADLDRIRAEQQEQLEGRERALKRLDEARKTYDKVYESRIETLIDEKTAIERAAMKEAGRQEEMHIKEKQESLEDWLQEKKTIERAFDAREEELRSDLLKLQDKCDKLSQELQASKELVDKYVHEIEERNMLLNGYVALVNQAEAEGILPQNSGSHLGLVNQMNEAMAMLQLREEDVNKLREALEKQREIITDYRDAVETLNDKSEMYLLKSREQDLQLQEGLRERDSFMAQVIVLEDRVRELEEELQENDKEKDLQENDKEEDLEREIKMEIKDEEVGPPQEDEDTHMEEAPVAEDHLP
ncbi:hypothetical protein BGZ99_005398 [Dissophora globulifera]|uniref:Uncharacterized protein n=1 Tax=Dissophora globulifera TaxID=979702 RepID=A0A9P6RJ11_9FUNG|nr:hypothetical protein BGZ99_005398 [Dissophora globulifera]